jgi:septum site-determining protein MinD
VILDEESDAGSAYADSIARFLGEDVPHRFIEEKSHWLKRLFRFKESAIA